MLPLPHNGNVRGKKDRVRIELGSNVGNARIYRARVYQLSPRKILIRLSASIAFKIVNQYEYALEL